MLRMVTVVEETHIIMKYWCTIEIPIVIFVLAPMLYLLPNRTDHPNGSHLSSSGLDCLRYLLGEFSLDYEGESIEIFRLICSIVSMENDEKFYKYWHTFSTLFHNSNPIVDQYDYYFFFIFHLQMFVRT